MRPSAPSLYYHTESDNQRAMSLLRFVSATCAMSSLRWLQALQRHPEVAEYVASAVPTRMRCSSNGPRSSTNVLTFQYLLQQPGALMQRHSPMITAKTMQHCTIALHAAAAG
mmetsp:Transcript_40114/g.94432  ORF Transcript_40114/g.94432 Transcript_40114/m.94432 type:complete len:112 (-) Transcript_40114:47-382(-)